MKKWMWSAVLLCVLLPGGVVAQTYTVSDPGLSSFEWTQPAGPVDGSADPETFTVACGTMTKTGLGPYVSGQSIYTTLVGSVVTAPGTYVCTVRAVNAAGSSAPSPSITVILQQFYQLAVAKKGSGTVASVPAGINCGLTCNASFVQGASVTLTATPAAGFIFKSWSGDCTGTANTCTVAMNGVKSVTASFLGVPTSPTNLNVK